MNLLDALKAVKAKVEVDPIDGDSKFHGICPLLLREFRMDGQLGAEIIVDVEFRRVFMQWPEYSGNISYPVPYDTEEDFQQPDRAYRQASEYGQLWYGEYGAARRRLLDWAIKYLEER